MVCSFLDCGPISEARNSKLWAKDRKFSAQRSGEHGDLEKGPNAKKFCKSISYLTS